MYIYIRKDNEKFYYKIGHNKGEYRSIQKYLIRFNKNK